MHRVLRILVYCVLWLDAFDRGYTAKAPVDPELLANVAKNVKSVLSTTLVEELQSAQSNRSAVNVALTAPRNHESSHPSINGKKPEIQFNNHIYPYHYERSYHYAYPPSSSTNPSESLVDFYRPYFRQLSPQDSSYYRSSSYDPYPAQFPNNNNAIDSQENQKIIVDTNTNAHTNVANNADKTGHYRSSETPYSTSLPPSNTFANPEILSPAVPRSNQFPSVDFDRFRHNVLGKPAFSAESNRHYLNSPPVFGSYRSSADNYPYPPPYQNSLHAPTSQNSQNSQNSPESALAYQTAPPPNHPAGPYSPPLSSYSQPPSHPSPITNQSPYAPPFFGSFHQQGYPSPPYNFPSTTRFNNMFNDNFTSSFPPRSPFGGFYPNHNVYLGPPPAPGSQSNVKLDDRDHLTPISSYPPSPPINSGLQMIPTIKQNEADPSSASSSNYAMKLFFPPIRDDYNLFLQPRAFRQFTFTTKHYGI